ncbi:hypothetical protein [Streptomyces sp. YPW6]|uniref:hypothetical protein n=1 Tax=Streptomyces sp. YPW6 TaxID=2840373 RepID=UPI003D73878D
MTEQIRSLISEYRDLEAERSEYIKQFFNEDGEAREENYPRYDEARIDNALAAEDELGALEELIQPQV